MGNFIIQSVEFVKKITRWLVFISAVAIAILMVVNFSDIVGTKFFGMSIPGALDISEELMVLVTLLPIAFIALERGHIRITLLEEHLHSNIRYALEVIQYIIATFITGFITVRAFSHLQNAYEVMTLKAGLDLPEWPANIAVVVAFGFLTIVWFLLLAKTIVVGREQQEQ